MLVGPLADAPHSESVVPQLVTFARRALGVPERARAAMTAPETGVSDADS
ncbi:Uncharacterised protein [Mycobacteroides abscessus subsp. abscessus]|nr:Uncharacterised protein [Mycobacteroides abscessus subsp. abscessus]